MILRGSLMLYKRGHALATHTCPPSHCHRPADDKKSYRAYRDELRGLPAGVGIVPHLGAHTLEITLQDQLLPTEVRECLGHT